LEPTLGEIANNNQRLNRQFLRWDEMRVRSFFFGFKPGGSGFSRKSEGQTDVLLLRPGFKIRAIVKHVLQEPLSFFIQEVKGWLKFFHHLLPLSD
jgi:hypothetical protein